MSADQTAVLPGAVVHYSGPASGRPDSHDALSRAWVAQRLAGLLGYGYAGEYDDASAYGGRVYFVPRDTLDTDTAQALGIHDEGDLFGGVVPYAFLTTKAIAHPLIEHAHSPPGWSHDFGLGMSGAVLPGYSAFNPEDARRAGRRVLEHGPARVKAGDGIGGRGQTVAGTPAELDAAIDALDASSLGYHGVVIEQNLEDVTTYSVGRVQVGSLIASYVGTQRLTRDNSGAEVYGGSDLLVVRGDYEALEKLPLAMSFRTAVERARVFDAAVARAYPGFLASRRNYDIAEGRDAGGTTRVGLLEQSWRIGGASPAEVLALEAFRDNPRLDVAQASCVELYGDEVSVPPGAIVYYGGVDARVGRLTKYAFLQNHASPA